jgi:hypothetical protein
MSEGPAVIGECKCGGFGVVYNEATEAKKGRCHDTLEDALTPPRKRFDTKSLKAAGVLPDGVVPEPFLETMPTLSPTPWRVAFGNVVDANGDVIAAVNGSAHDAAMLAAAPKLLHALIRLLGIVESAHGSVYYDAQKQANEAIASATTASVEPRALATLSDSQDSAPRGAE